MKKFFTVIMFICLVPGLRAETLKDAYEKIASVEGSKNYNMEETAKILIEFNSNLSMMTCTSVS